jgi:hypothetical protein
MLLIFASAILASAPSAVGHLPVRPQVQATATVRIISGVQLRLDGRANPHAPAPRPAMIELERGTAKVAARLIEFE